MTYEKHYCTVAWCCPSRVNFFTGRAAHNTNITSAQPPHGGWTRFGELGLNDNYLPVWLSDAGVNTYVCPTTQCTVGLLLTPSACSTLESS